MLWLWVHVLQLGLANQTLPHAIAEDAINKPDRPLPSRRISLQTARALRWIMIPLCLLLSAAYGPRTMLASFAASLFMLAYNEGGGAGSHWLVRNALNAVGYAVAEAGATLVACTSPLLSSTPWLSLTAAQQQVKMRVRLTAPCALPLR